MQFQHFILCPKQVNQNSSHCFSDISPLGVKPDVPFSNGIPFRFKWCLFFIPLFSQIVRICCKLWHDFDVQSSLFRHAKIDCSITNSASSASSVYALRIISLALCLSVSFPCTRTQSLVHKIGRPLKLQTNASCKPKRASGFVKKLHVLMRCEWKFGSETLFQSHVHKLPAKVEVLKDGCSGEDWAFALSMAEK